MASLENDVSSLSRFERLNSGFKAIRDVPKTLTHFSRAEIKLSKRQPIHWKLSESREVWEGRKGLQIGVEFIACFHPDTSVAEGQQARTVQAQGPAALSEADQLEGEAAQQSRCRHAGGEEPLLPRWAWCPCVQSLRYL